MFEVVHIFPSRRAPLASMSRLAETAELDLHVKYRLLLVGYAPHEMSSVTKAHLRKRKKDVSLMLHPDKNRDAAQISSRYFQEFKSVIDWLLDHSRLPEGLSTSATVDFWRVDSEVPSSSSTFSSVARVDVNETSGQRQLEEYACGCGVNGCVVKVDMARDPAHAKTRKGRRNQYHDEACVISCYEGGCEAYIFTRHTYCRPLGWTPTGSKNFYCPAHSKRLW